jgi:hypothetical protein
MILFKLKCTSGHEFEAWFRDNAAYDRQQGRGLIGCPECGSTEVDKAPMAPRLKRSEERRAPSPAELRRALQQLRRHVEATCDNVGDRFAEEARRIHRGEVEPHGIYGDATDEQATELADEGIAVARLPWVPTSDA